MYIDKVLIFNSYPCRPTDGGPSGFIGQNLIDHKSDFYRLASDFSPNYSRSFSGRVKRKILSMHAKLWDKSHSPVPAFFKDWGDYCRYLFRSCRTEQYKIVYFHDIFSLQFCLDLIGDKQRVILQPHMPELPHQEMASYEDTTQEKVEWTKLAENNAFNRANDLIFPNEGAMNIYKTLISKKHRIHYLNSGAKQVENTQIIPLDISNIYLLFVGRRNYIKGFDIIVEAFKKAYEKRKDIKLIIVGKGKQESHEGIIDIGFSYRVHDWITSCDYVVNCNRQSYMDLIVLETLSVGTPLIISQNYGHKAFNSKESCGLIDIGLPTVENLIKVFLSLKVKACYNQRGINENKLIYRLKYSSEVYLSNLNKCLMKLLNEEQMAQGKKAVEVLHYE